MWLDDFIWPKNSKSSFDVENDSESLGGVEHSTFNDDDDDYDLEAGSQQADDSYDMSQAITNDFAINDSASQPKNNYPASNQKSETSEKKTRRNERK